MHVKSVIRILFGVNLMKEINRATYYMVLQHYFECITLHKDNDYLLINTLYIYINSLVMLSV